MKVGYIRVSTTEQNTIRQEVLMEQLGVGKVFIDKSSGKSTNNRPKLEDMMSFVREGDVVVVSEISRFARNTKDLLNLIDELKSKGVGFESQKEKIDTESDAGKFMLTVFGAIAELERGYIKSRQREGIECAKAEGRYQGRPRADIDYDKFLELYKKWKSGECTATYCYKELGIPNTRFYRYVREYEKQQGTYVRKGKLGYPPED